MRALLIAILAALMVALPVSAQEQRPTWQTFQAEVANYRIYLAHWVADVAEVTSAEELELYYAELLAVSLDHLATTANTLWDDCYKEYGKDYTTQIAWANNWIAGVYLVATAPAIEPPSNESAQIIGSIAQALGFVTGNSESLSTCETPQTLNPADFPTA
jgi:hypothetical protein